MELNRTSTRIGQERGAGQVECHDTVLLSVFFQCDAAAHVIVVRGN